MKKGHLVFNIVLSIAVIILFFLVLSAGGKNDCVKNGETMLADSLSISTSLVYVNTDSLLLNYEYAKYLNEELLKKEEKSRTDFNERARSFQGELAEFQRKVQNNGFLSRERAIQEEQRLAQKDKDLQDLNSRLSNELMVHQNEVSVQLRDSLVNYLKILKQTMNFEVVMSNSMGDNILYSSAGIDITPMVTKGLNERYQSGKK